MQDPDVVLFPSLPGEGALEDFRHRWMLLRRTRAVVPCPEDTPLPSKRHTKEHRAKLFNIYLRPWTLIASQATHRNTEEKDMDTTQDSGRQLQESVIHPRVQEAVRVVNKLLSNDLGMKASGTSTQKHTACTLHRSLPDTVTEKHAALLFQTTCPARLEMYRHDWESAYAKLCTDLESSAKPPYGRQ